MPHYEWTGDGSYQDHANDRIVEPGEVVELAERIGEPNTELVRVSDEEVGDEASSDGDEENEEEGTEEGTEEEAFEIETWLDQDYQTRADRVEDGDVDEHLDTIAEAETSQTVQNAIDDRRDG